MSKKQTTYEIDGLVYDDSDIIRIDSGDLDIERPFYIVSELHGFCLDVFGEGVKDATPVCVYPRKFTNNQLWVCTTKGEIKSIFNGLVLDIKGNNLKEGTSVILYKANGGLNQQWDLKDNLIVSRANGLVLDIIGASKKPGAYVCMWKAKKTGDNDNQLWHIEYA